MRPRVVVGVGACVWYLHQSLHLGSVCIQILSQTASFHTELGQLSPQRSYHLIETHLNTAQRKKKDHHVLHCV